MYERYPISGIKEPYSHVQGTKTVVMPVLIVVPFLAQVAFYFRGEPLFAPLSPEPPAELPGILGSVPGLRPLEVGNLPIQ